MGILMGWIAIIVGGAAIGAVLGWVAFFQTRDLRTQIAQLQAEVARLSQQRQSSESGQESETSEPDQAFLSRSRSDAPQTTATESESTPPQFYKSGEGRPASDRWRGVSVLEPTSDRAAKQRSMAGQSGPQPPWLQALLDSWMTWLGGISVALAGIFMVKYGIDAGLLGPGARITLALLTGLGLHLAAEWLRRSTGGSDPVFAALAGGASITLYGGLLAALHLYRLLDPGWTFLMLAAVSLMTMALSLLHGPLLAMIGLIGAYVVPILVSDNSGNIVGAMIYSLIISGAALLLLRYVYRPWLWWGVVAGSFGWWLISLTAHQSVHFRGLYLALLAWGLVAIPSLDWLLLRAKIDPGHSPEPGTQTVPLLYRGLTDNSLLKGSLLESVQLIQLTLLLVILAWGVSIAVSGFTVDAFALWAPLVVVLCLAARQRPDLRGLPWLSLVVQWPAWLLASLSFDPAGGRFLLSALTGSEQSGFLAYAGLMALLYTGMALLHVRAQGFSHCWFSLVLLAPLAWLALAWLRVNGLSQSLTWSLLTLIVGAGYASLAGWRLTRQSGSGLALWFTLGAHCAYSLAVTMYFREASLTLALAAQMLSLSWLLQRYRLPWLGTIIKVLVAVVVARLTFNPWLLSYPADIHWSLWTYGGATLFAWLAARCCRFEPVLYRWLMAATLHLLVLTLGTEVRYWLYDGNIFVRRYSLTESAINASLWAAMALTYYQRARVSENLGTFYRTCSRILLALAAASYGCSLTLNNPWWSHQDIGTTPIFNILLLAYGLPVIMALLAGYYHEPVFRRRALAIAGAGLLLFLSLEVRHLWQGGHLALSRITGDGELYTYSVVWLLLSIAAILGGTHWQLRDLYRSGMALLAVVIAKIFLVDMSDLQGLWRVASFMGLGLTLLALAWLHGRMQGRSAHPEKNEQ